MMPFQYEITAADLNLAQALAAKYCQGSVQKSVLLRILRACAFISLMMAIAMAVGLFEKYSDSEFGYDARWFAYSTFAFVALFIVYLRIYRKKFAEWREAKLGPFPIQQKLSVTQDGLEVESRFGRVFYPWNCFHSLSALSEHFSLTTSAPSVVVIPFRAFPSDEEREKFEADARSRIA